MSKAKVSKRGLMLQEFLILIIIGFSFYFLWIGFKAYIDGQLIQALLYMTLGISSLAISISSFMRIRTILSLLKPFALHVITELICDKCGFKRLREFEQEDYVFKKIGECPKCKGRSLYISSIYPKEKEKRAFRTGIT